MSFWIWKKWKERGKNRKIWISQERKELFRWSKKHFSVFEGLSFGEKIKIWSKIADTSFNNEPKRGHKTLQFLQNTSYLICAWKIHPGRFLWKSKCSNSNFKQYQLPPLAVVGDNFQSQILKWVGGRGSEKKLMPGGGSLRVPAIDICLGGLLYFFPEKTFKVKYGFNGSFSSADLGLF